MHFPKTNCLQIAGTGTRWYRVKGGKRGFVCKKPSTHFAKKEKATTARAACPSGYIWFQSTESCYKVVLLVFLG